MRAYYCDEFVLPLPTGHRFPMSKYSRLRERVVEEGILTIAQLFVPAAASRDDLLRVHDVGWVDRVLAGELSRSEVRKLGFPWSPQLVERSRRSVGATIEAMRSAREDGTAVNLAGGTHHAMADAGAGFCVFNDVAVATRVAQAEGLTRIAVLDTDVHQGDGTAAIFEGDDSVLTVSIHGARNFPLEKQVSDLDLPLPDDTEDDGFLAALADGLAALGDFEPELVFHVAGADPLASDKLGRLSVSKVGLAERDRRVVRWCREGGVPLVAVMAGGYAALVEDTVDVHVGTVRAMAAAR